jgi:hypothetical protein
MASTRNINTRCNYNLEQRINNNIFDYQQYQNCSSGKAYDEAIPCFGIYPSKLSMDTLSNNPIDIETQLRGIGSSNLVFEQPVIKPDLKTIRSIKFYDRLALQLPEPLIIETNQRPLRR